MRFPSVDDRFARDSSDAIDRHLREALQYGIEVETFIKDDPVGKVLYEQARLGAIEAMVDLMSTETLEEATALLTSRYMDLKMAATLIQHFSHALKAANQASDRLMSPQQPLPER